MEERWSTEIVRGVLASEADVGIIVEGIRTEGLETVPYCTDRIAVVMPSHHSLVRVPTMKFSDILDDDLIALESSSAMMRLLAEQAVIAERTLELRVEVRSFEAVCRMVQAGLGLGLLPLHAANMMAKGLGLAVRPLAEDWAERRMLLCVKKERMASSSIAKLLAHLGKGRLAA